MPPVPWIDKAIRVTHSFTSHTKGKHYLYIALLKGVDRERPGFTLYVGETALAPEQRFLKHKSSGITASPRVT